MNLLEQSSQSSHTKGNVKPSDELNSHQGSLDHQLGDMTMFGTEIDEDTLANYCLTASLLVMLGAVAAYGSLSS